MAMKLLVAGSLGLLTWAAASVSPAAGQTGERYAFVLELGRDTFAVENVTRVPGRLTTELTGRAIGRLGIRADLGAEGTIQSLSLIAWRPGSPADSAPGQAARIVMEGDTAVVTFSIPEGTPDQRVATKAGAMAYLNPSFALVEQALRRARSLGGDSVTVPMFLIQGGRTMAATVAWGAEDSATVELAGSTLHLVFSGDGRLLSGSVPSQNLTITRVDGAHLAPLTMAPPDYSAPPGAPYTAEDVRVPTPGGFELAGTLTRPAGEGPFPAVVLITGSGSQDRDEAIPMIAGYRPFREIADTLSRRGIAVLRLDDRGYGASGGEAADATSEDFADDIQAAVRWLGDQRGIDASRLGLVGHSEGGLIAPMVAARDTTLAAMVLIAGPAETGREIIHYQQRYAIEHNPGISPAGRDSAEADAQRQLEALAERQPWIGFFLDYDPLPTARKVKDTPVLILQGATDRQVTPGQADTLAAAFRAGGNPDVTEHVFPDMDHLMLPDTVGDPAGYATLKTRHVSPALLGTMADWLASRLETHGEVGGG